MVGPGALVHYDVDPPITQATPDDPDSMELGFHREVMSRGSELREILLILACPPMVPLSPHVCCLFLHHFRKLWMFH